MNKLLVFLLIIISFFWWNKHKHSLFAKKVLPPISIENKGKNEDQITSLDPCQGKKMCALVYIAPWCSACEQIAPYLKQIAAKVRDDNENGFLIVVGAGNEKENQEKVSFYESHTIADNDSSISKSLGISYYPTFLVINSDRKIELKDQEAANWIQKNL